MSHVTHVNASYHRYEWVMSHMWMRHIAHINGSCHRYVKVVYMSLIWMSHTTRTNESCRTCEWVMSHIWMSHVAHTNESCHRYKCSYHRYEWVISHVWMHHVTHMNELLNFKLDRGTKQATQTFHRKTQTQTHTQTQIGAPATMTWGHMNEWNDRSLRFAEWIKWQSVTWFIHMSRSRFISYWIQFIR